MFDHPRTLTMTASTLTALTLTLTAALAGCGGSQSQAQKGPEEQPGVGSTASASAAKKATDEPKARHSDYPASTDIAKKELPVDPESAVAAARDQGAVGNVYAIGADYDRLNRTWSYDVQTKTKKQGFRAQIDAVTREPIESGINSTPTSKPVDPDGKLKYEDALKLAQQKAGGKLTAWDLRTEGTKPAYSFDIEGDSGAVTTVSVDVATQKVSIKQG